MTTRLAPSVSGNPFPPLSGRETVWVPEAERIPFGCAAEIGIYVGAIHAQRPVPRTVRVRLIASYLLAGDGKLIEGSTAARSRRRILHRLPVQESFNDVGAIGNTLVASRNCWGW